LVDLGDCEGWASFELNLVVTIEAERRRRTTTETLSLDELQVRYPHLSRAIAEEVAMMIRPCEEQRC
jgi:hypothetical protein